MARGLGVSRESVYYLITLRNFTGFLSPVFGPLSERHGRRTMLVVAMALLAAGSLIVFLWPSYWFLGLALCTVGVAKIIYDPAMQAYVGDQVPYERRGRAIAITEYSWSFALLVGVPLAGVAIQRQGWQAPFLWIGLGGILGAILLWRTIADGRRSGAMTVSSQRLFALLREHHVVLFASLYMMLFLLANEMLFIVFGGWMEDTFQLSLTSLGLSAAIIGGAELAGETLAGWSVDRFGKRRVIIMTGLVTSLCYLLLPFASATLAGALVTLFVLFLAFEITIVGGVPLMTELVPASRAVVMSMMLAAMFAGRTVGSFVGPLVWNWLGFALSGLVWAVIAAVAILILAVSVREAT